MIEFYLDWNKHQLFVWEKVKSDRVIDAIVRGIEAGDKFPPVYVHRVKDRETLFVLSGAHGHGGHNRAVGHYIAGQPLTCILEETSIDPAELPESGRYSKYIPVEKVVLTEFDDEYYEGRKKEKFYR